MRVLRIIGYCVAGLIAGYFVIACGAAFWPVSVFGGESTPTKQAFADEQRAVGVVTDQVYPYVEERFAARDGASLFARVFGAPAGRTVVLLHGVASDSAAMNTTAGLIQAATGAQVIAVDLRGHGHSGSIPWHVTYAGQYEDDVADIVTALRAAQPRGKIILAGHSMGGGVALNYSARQNMPAVDGYLLFAPLLGGNSPTGATAAAGPSPKVSLVYFRTPRLIGVLMLNLVGLHTLNDLPILYFNHPGLPQYGFAALQSMQPNAPRDYRVALRAIKVPLLVVVGSKDEAFNASAYPDVLRASGHAESAVIIEGSTHNRVLNDPRTIDVVGKWFSKI
jgi:pimeloyl-ACP methyl ester carboxylesterase